MTLIIVGIVIMVVSEAGTLAGNRAVRVVEYTDRVDRLHRVRRRVCVSRAR
jgi:hypothetical protein